MQERLGRCPQNRMKVRLSYRYRSTLLALGTPGRCNQGVGSESFSRRDSFNACIFQVIWMTRTQGIMRRPDVFIWEEVADILVIVRDDALLSVTF